MSTETKPPAGEREQLHVQIAKLRELMEDIRDASDEFVSKRFRTYARELLYCLPTSNTDWLKEHDAEVRRKTLLWIAEEVEQRTADWNLGAKMGEWLRAQTQPLPAPPSTSKEQKK